MNICRLKPEFVEPLALALFEEWHDFAPWSSLNKIRAYYAQCLNGDNLPLAFTAVDNKGRLMGSAALKRFDMACFPEHEYWLCDVFVLPQFRGLGVGRQLVSFCLDKARELGLPHLYLYPASAFVVAAFAAALFGGLECDVVIGNQAGSCFT